MNIPQPKFKLDTLIEIKNKGFGRISDVRITWSRGMREPRIQYACASICDWHDEEYIVATYSLSESQGEK